MLKKRHHNPSSQPQTATEKPSEEKETKEMNSQESETNSTTDDDTQLADALKQIAELEDKNLRMMAEFENYRRRTNKEKLALIDTAGEHILTDMLPLIDDFERSLQGMQQLNNDNLDAFREGVDLIYKKFITFLEKNKVTAIDTENQNFNTDEHEAITTFAAGEEKKGKIIDCTQKGYKLGEKVIRFAKVVVGE